MRVCAVEQGGNSMKGGLMKCGGISYERARGGDHDVKVTTERKDMTEVKA